MLFCTRTGHRGSARALEQNKKAESRKLTLSSYCILAVIDDAEAGLEPRETKVTFAVL